MSWRTDVQNTLRTLKENFTHLSGRINDEDARFQEHVRRHSARPQIKIEHNPINNMYEWEIYPPEGFDIHGRSYMRGCAPREPISEGRVESYQTALDAVIYHEARWRLGLPNKPNGVTKNY